MEEIIKLNFLVLLTGILIYFIYGALLNILAARWPKTSGRVLSSEIKRDDNAEVTTWSPLIEYKYEIKGQEYTSKNIAFGLFAGFKFLASPIYKDFQSDSQIEVSYNPKMPQQSVILTGLKFFHLFNIGLSGGILYFSVLELFP